MYPFYVNIRMSVVAGAILTRNVLLTNKGH